MFDRPFFHHPFHKLFIACFVMTEVKSIDRSVVEYELKLVIHCFILIDLYDINQVKITSLTYQCRKLVADLTNGI